MKKTLLLWLMLIMLSFSGVAQETVIVGTGGYGSNNSVPTHLWYDYSVSQTIYLSSEIGTGGTITSISFKNLNTSTQRNIKVYMAETQMSSFASTGSALSYSDFTEVFDGTWTITQNEWSEIALNLPFEYSGDGNLVVAVLDNTNAQESSGLNWQSTEGTGRSVSNFRDNTIFDFSNVTYNNVRNYFPDVQLVIEGGQISCHAVSSLEYSDVTSNSVLLSWEAAEDGGDYIVMYKTDSQSWEDEDVVTENTTSTSISLYDLLPNTTYNVRVYNDCGGGEQSAARSITFRTDCEGITEVPQTWTFDETLGANTLPQCWTRGSASATSPYCYSYSYYSHSGTYSLYFYNANGMAIMQPIDPNELNVAELQVSFYALKSSSTSNASIIVGIMTDPNDDSTFEPVATINPTTSHLLYEVPFMNYEGDGVYIALKNGNQDAGLYVDDLTLEMIPDCSAPSNLAVNATPTEAEFSWISTATDFNFYYRQANEETWTVEEGAVSPVIISGLTPATAYQAYVAAFCGDDTLVSNTINFQTPCEGITEVPQTWDFESGNTAGTTSSPLPQCWTRNGSAYPYTYSYSAHQGSYCLYFSSTNSTGVMRAVNTDYLNMNELQVTFWAKQGYSNANVQVGIMTDPTDFSTFELISDITLTSTYQQYEVPFSAYEGEGTYIAFKSPTYNSVYIDDLVLEEIPACSKPQNLTAVKNEDGDIVLSWTSTGETFDVYYKPQTETEWNFEEINDHTYTLSGLNPSMLYEWYVEAVCDGQNIASETLTFVTECALITEIPQTWDFENNNGGGSANNPLPTCWQRNSSTTYPYISTLNVHSGTKCLYNYNSGSRLAVLPQIDVESLNINELQLTFWARKSGSSANNLEVGVMTDPTAAATFKTLGTVSLTDTYEAYDVVLSGYEEGDGSYLAIRFTANDYNYTYIDDVVLQEISNCPKIQSVTVTSIGANEASIEWVGVNESYIVRFRPQAETTAEWNTTDVVINGNTAVLSNLTANTTYLVQVAPNCDEIDDSYYKSATFTTTCSTYDIPYFTSFEGNEDACWTIAQQGYYLEYDYEYYDEAYFPEIETYSSYAKTGTHYATIGSEDGEMMVWAAPKVNANIENLRLEFFARKYYSSSYYELGTLQVGVMSNPSDTSTFVLVADSIEVASTTYELKVVDFNNAGVSGPDYYIAFRYIGAGTSDFNEIFVDDITIREIPSCLEPTALQVLGTTTESANLAWSSEDVNFTVYVKEASAETYVESEGTVSFTDTVYTFTITGLQSGTQYNAYVATVCADGSESASQPITFITECEAISSLPQTWDMESNNIAGTTSYPLPACWQRGTSSIYPYASTYGGHSGSRALYFSGTNTTAVLPQINTAELSYSNMQLEFYARYSYSPSTLMVGVMTNPNDITTFDTVVTITLTSAHELYSVPLSNYAGEGSYIAIMSPTSNTIYVDDVTLSEVSECSRPSGVNVVEITSNSAKLSWISTAETFNLYYKEVGAESYESVDEISLESDGTYTIYDLEPATSYEWYVEAVCADTNIASIKSTFQTLCLPITELPRTWDFESDNYGGTSSNPLPICWTRQGTGSYPYSYSSSSNSHSGSYLLYFYNYGNTAVLPEIDTEVYPINTLQINMFAKTSAYSSNVPLVIGVVPTPESTQFDTLSVVTLSSTYQKFEVSLANYQGQGGYVAIRSGSSSTIYVDDVTLEEIPDCSKPDNLAVSNITSTSVDLTWTSTGDNFNIYYKADAESEYTIINDVTLEDGVYTISDLTPATNYQWYVEVVCADTNIASATSTFQTACLPITEVPQTWDFENGNTGGTSAYPLPICWSRGNSNTPYVYSYGAYAGQNSLYFSSTNSYAVLNAIDPDALTLQDLQLSFYARRSYSTASLEVGVMTDPSDVATFTTIQTIELPTDYTLYEVLFSTYEGEGNYIAIKSPTYGSVYVDDVVLDNAPACPKVQNVTVTEVTESTATITWTASNEAGYNVKYREIGAEEWIETTTPTESITITDLMETTSYEVGISPICDEEVPFVYATFSTSMVAANLPYSTDFNTATGWLLNNGNCSNYWTAGTPAGSTVSALYVTNNGTEAGYSVTSQSTIVAEKAFNTGSADSVHVEFDLKIGGEVLSYGAYDFLKVFLAPNETEFEAGNSSTTQSSYSYSTNAFDFSAYATSVGSSSYPYIIALSDTTTNLHISMNVVNPAPNGVAKLVFLWRNDGSSGTQPGAIISNLSVSSEGAGPAVVNPTVATNDATNVTETTATLNGTITNPGNQTITARGFEWKAVSGGTVATVSATGTTNFTAPLTGLAEGTEYTFRAFATTANGNSYGQWKNFTTNSSSVEPCNTPTNVAASNITKESMTITWNANGASKWNLQYRVVNGAWSTVTVEGNPTYTITDLTEATEYQIQVQAVCDGATSPWSTMISQSTGINARLMGSISLYPNPASNYVDVRVSDNDIAVSRLEVYDVYGKLINEVEVIENPTRINVENLASGMYFVKVITNDGVATKNFIKK